MTPTYRRESATEIAFRLRNRIAPQPVFTRDVDPDRAPVAVITTWRAA